MAAFAVRVNHDFHSGQQDEVRRFFVEAGVRVLDGNAVELEEVGCAESFARGPFVSLTCRRRSVRLFEDC